MKYDNMLKEEKIIRIIIERALDGATNIINAHIIRIAEFNKQPWYKRLFKTI